MDEEFDFEWEERQEGVGITTHFLAGSLAGLTEHLIILPFDNIKTHLQSGT
jgi:solute carrier family 25 iron transporter 28/37